MKTAADVLKEAARLVGGDREQQHGDKTKNFANIARFWDAYLLSRDDKYGRRSLDAIDVGHMMVLMKIARTQAGDFNMDDYVDAAGYAGCAAQVAKEVYDKASARRAADASASAGYDVIPLPYCFCPICAAARTDSAQSSA